MHRAPTTVAAVVCGVAIERVLFDVPSKYENRTDAKGRVKAEGEAPAEFRFHNRQGQPHSSQGSFIQADQASADQGAQPMAHVHIVPHESRQRDSPRDHSGNRNYQVSTSTARRKARGVRAASGSLFGERQREGDSWNTVRR